MCNRILNSNLSNKCVGFQNKKLNGFENIGVFAKNIRKNDLSA